MIPEVIHYCWFGGKEMPALARKCLDSWKKFLPGYEIKRWDESNFDVNIIPYTAGAYAQGKYAFVSDYARFWILYNYGGLYFDTDVEIIRPMEHIISSGPFMGRENASVHPTGKLLGSGVAPGLGIGAEKGNPVYKEILDYYERLGLHLEREYKTETVVTHITRIFEGKGLKADDNIQTIDGIKIYPKQYFCPVDPVTGRIEITPDTVSIHRYAASWQPSWKRFKNRLKRLLGSSAVARYIGVKNRFLNRK